MENQLELKTGQEENDDFPEAPVLVNGEAVTPRKRGRPKGSKNRISFSAPSLSGSSAPAPSVSAKPSKKAKLTLNLADTFGPELVSQAARAPIFGGDMLVSVISKGKLAPINYIPQGPMLAVDEFFKENVLKGGIEFDVSPIQGWIALCGLALLSGIVGQTAEYAFKLKAEAGTLPNVRPNGSAGPELSSAPPSGMEEVPGQQASRSEPSA